MLHIKEFDATASLQPQLPPSPRYQYGSKCVCYFNFERHRNQLTFLHSLDFLPRAIYVQRLFFADKNDLMRPEEAHLLILVHV